MFFCYLDESGTPEIPGTSSHYILVGLSIPVKYWQKVEQDINSIKHKYGLHDKEIHTAWLRRRYIEQRKISNFDLLPIDKRIFEIEKYRRAELLRLQKVNNKQYSQTKKNYKETTDYIHLTLEERENFLLEIASAISGWNFATLFAECIDKISFDPRRSAMSISEQAFMQVVTRFDFYLLNCTKEMNEKQYGLLLHDNNLTVEKKHAELMKSFQKKGTLWKDINHIIETPLFVNSGLTNMIQLADLCAYAIRRYLENNENELFDLVFQRVDIKNGKRVGIRHFPGSGCNCVICQSHK